MSLSVVFSTLFIPDHVDNSVFVVVNSSGTVVNCCERLPTFVKCCQLAERILNYEREEELIALVRKIQRRQTEFQTVELKAAQVDFPKKIYDTLSSFSNQDNGGVIIFQISKHKKIPSAPRGTLGLTLSAL